ncbi:MAG: adenylyl-sulfate kinase [Flavobacteriaceae bacterium]|jgi:adenylylsulfate kinase-like enzyme|nr:adenylyl-sulfate kinase [Flavobacteriaceae bacterium]MBT3920561.1 adenylyl-sulfate kinase [Flavobacteriaceae bacterium]
MVIWFLGISGSGKSTLGNKLKGHFDKNNIRSFLLDGDIVRDFFDNDLGYSLEERKQNIKRILLTAYALEKNGIIPIVCNISPFESLRYFAREKFQNYVQIYLHKEIKEAQKNDVKNIYKDNLNITPIVGLDLDFEKPLHNELVIDVDKETEDESFYKILTYLENK